MAAQLPAENGSQDRLNTDEVKSERAVSDPQPVNAKKTLKIDYFSGVQKASFISQRSSSFDSTESLLTSDDEITKQRPQGQSTLVRSNDADFENNVFKGNNDEFLSGGHTRSVSGSDYDETRSPNFSFNGDTLSSSMLNPAHQSTPVHYRSLPTVTEEVSNMGASIEHAAGEDGELADKDIFMPGDLHTPILGFETMEARSRFTVFKIQVEKRGDPAAWFVFRRYSDFLHLNERLKFMFPGFRLALPPKRWFRDNFDKEFLEDRVLGLQAFLNNIVGHKDICNSAPVRDFLCVDEPPGPHDSLEESRALCDKLEESMYTLRQDLQEKEAEVELLKEELELYKSQVELLSSRLRDMNASGLKGESVVSPVSARHSLAECDRHSPLSPDTAVASDTRTQPAGAESVREASAKNADAKSTGGSQGSSDDKTC